MNTFLASICCAGILSFFSLNILISLERVFSQPLYILKSSFFNSKSVNPLVKPASKYTIVLVGDSMTETLGSGESITYVLKKYYPKKEIHILNYGIGSTSILTLPKRLREASSRGNELLPAILSKDFDVILIESFGNNPLSNFSLNEGLKKQSETLEQSIKLIREQKPKAVIIFVATIAPNKQRYGEGVVTLGPKEREQWANERISYIKNHMDFAKAHNIPLIDIFDKSLVNGDGNIDFVNNVDFIHPSDTGLTFIGKEIGEFIFSQRILPL